VKNSRRVLEEDKSHPLQQVRTWLTLVFGVPVVVAITIAFLVMGNTLGRLIGALFLCVLLLVGFRVLRHRDEP
jgi:hypothetical protein